jgi:proline iminopeptidase
MKDVGANGIRMAYTEAGDGTPLLCLHGGMGIDAYALRVPGVLDLANHGIRVVIPDQRGHGGSSRSDPSQYNRFVWAADARALAEQLGFTRHALLGYSYGGFIALEYALRWPETLSHLVLVATSAGPVPAQTQALENERALRRFFRGVWPRFFEGEDKHWDLFERAQFTVEAYNAAFTHDLPTYDVRERVHEIDIPTLLVVGQHDPYVRDMEWLAKNMRHAELRILEGAGHFPFVDAGAAFTRAIAGFLAAR